jgi:hypothetical protein
MISKDSCSFLSPPFLSFLPTAPCFFELNTYFHISFLFIYI